MSANARTVASGSCPIWIAVLTAILRWPDRLQASGYIHGFGIVKDIQKSNVFREIPEQAIPSEELFGADAAPAAEQEWAETAADLACDR